MPAGRKAIPIPIKKAMGNPGKRPLGGHPTPEVKIPACPDYLCSDAKQEFFRIVPLLEKLRLISELDLAGLVAYCEAVADHKWAIETIANEGATYMTDKGYIGQHPAVAIKNKAVQVIKSFCIEFGMTPSARARMSMPDNPGDDEDDLD